jgi:hypothetical protein
MSNIGHRPPLCKKCGEDDPDKFYPKEVGTCKACRVARQTMLRETKPKGDPEYHGVRENNVYLTRAWV